MSNMVGKIQEKLHMGGHQKGSDPAQAAPAAPKDGGHAHHVESVGTDPVMVGTPGLAPAHEGPVDKMKNKIHGGKDKATPTNEGLM